MPATRQIRVASRNFADDQSRRIDRMTSVRLLPVAEQYPSNTETSADGASKSTSHTSLTWPANKKVPSAKHRHNHRRHGGMRSDGGEESCALPKGALFVGLDTNGLRPAKGLRRTNSCQPLGDVSRRPNRGPCGHQYAGCGDADHAATCSANKCRSRCRAIRRSPSAHPGCLRDPLRILDMWLCPVLHSSAI